MGCCISFIGSLLKKNKKKNTEIYPLQKNNKIKTCQTQKVFELTVENISNNYMNYIIFNYNKNNIFTEDSYIIFRDKINKKNGINKIIVNLKNTQEFIEYKDSDNHKNIQKILIYKNQDENYLYTYPPSPCINYNKNYQPDYNYNKSKIDLFNTELNKILINLNNLVNFKRNNFFNNIIKINK
jgi:hypothetical protein